MDPRQVLRQVFGYEAFRGPQEEIVAHVVAGGSGLVLMPTGGGKSLCYQVPALCRAGTAVVISPLIALMQDQVEALRQAGVRAAALHSGIEAAETQAIERDLRSGDLDLLYLSPERLLAGGLDRLARQVQTPRPRARGRAVAGDPDPCGLAHARTRCSCRSRLD